MAWHEGIYFTPGGVFWLRVHGNSAGNQFRAGTNDVTFYHTHVDRLEWRRTREAAQQDLDELAGRLSLVPVPPPVQAAPASRRT